MYGGRSRASRLGKVSGDGLHLGLSALGTAYARQQGRSEEHRGAGGRIAPACQRSHVARCRVASAAVAAIRLYGSGTGAVRLVREEPPGALPSLDPLRPPGEARRGADEVRLGLQGDAPFCLGILKLLYGGE